MAPIEIFIREQEGFKKVFEIAVGNEYSGLIFKDIGVEPGRYQLQKVDELVEKAVNQ